MHLRGVAILMTASAKRALMEWTPISKRIITTRFYSKYKNDALDEEKDEFYNTVSSCNRQDMIVVMGDMNAKVGDNITNRTDVMGKFDDNDDNGERLLDFGCTNRLVIT